MSSACAMRVGVMRDFGQDLGLKPEFFSGMPAEGVQVFGRVRDIEPSRRQWWVESAGPLREDGLIGFGTVRDSDSYGLTLHYQGIWEEGAPLFVLVDRADAERRVLELVDRYWDLAYQEGKEGRTHDTEEGSAQATRSELEEAIRLLR